MASCQLKPLARFECPCINIWVSTPAVVKILKMLNYLKGPNETDVFLVLRYVNRILVRRHFLDLFKVAVPPLNTSL